MLTTAILGAIAFVPAPARAGGCFEVTSGRSVAVDLKSMCVFPTLIRIPAGSDVTFTNRDEVNHIIVGAGSGWGSDGELRQGDSYTATFERDGVYPFQCYLHPGMSGAVLVGDANGRGAATSSGIVVAPPSGPPTPASERAPVQAPESSTASIRWPGVVLGILGALVLAAISTAAILRSRREAARPVESRP